MSSLPMGPQPSCEEKKEEICLLRRAGRKDAVCDWAYKIQWG